MTILVLAGLFHCVRCQMERMHYWHDDGMQCAKCGHIMGAGDAQTGR